MLAQGPVITLSPPPPPPHTHIYTNTVARYHELAAVGVEFLDAAERGARTVVDELFLPHEKKTVRAVAERSLDGRCKEAGRGVDGGVR